MIKFFDLAARDPRLRFSPYCWRTKMALKHKGLAFETTPWRFTDKDAIKPTDQGRVPTLIDGSQWLHDSWQIALYLDRTYPDRPALMHSDAERAAARFVNNWCDFTLHLAMRSLLLLDVYKNAAEKDQPYFRESREKAVGHDARAVVQRSCSRGAGICENLCADGTHAKGREIPRRRATELRRLRVVRLVAMGKLHQRHDFPSGRFSGGGMVRAAARSS